MISISFPPNNKHSLVNQVLDTTLPHHPQTASKVRKLTYMSCVKNTRDNCKLWCTSIHRRLYCLCCITFAIVQNLRCQGSVFLSMLNGLAKNIWTDAQQSEYFHSGESGDKTGRMLVKTPGQQSSPLGHINFLLLNKNAAPSLEALLLLNPRPLSPPTSPNKPIQLPHNHLPVITKSKS